MNRPLALDKAASLIPRPLVGMPATLVAQATEAAVEAIDARLGPIGDIERDLLIERVSVLLGVWIGDIVCRVLTDRLPRGDDQDG
ncbi:MAG: hypothetical protein U1F67_10425 [Rubrivivax sp.]